MCERSVCVAVRTCSESASPTLKAGAEKKCKVVIDFTYFTFHCEFHCEMKCEMIVSFHCEITFPGYMSKPFEEQRSAGSHGKLPSPPCGLAQPLPEPLWTSAPADSN